MVKKPSRSVRLGWLKRIIGSDIKPSQKLKSPLVLATVLVFAVIGAVVLYRSFAAGPIMSVEGEGTEPTRSGNLTTTASAAASSGNYVQFGAQSGARARYEARHATAFGPVSSAIDTIRLDQGLSYGSSGDLISYFEHNGDYVTFTVNAPAAGSYTMELGYAIALQVVGQPSSLRRNMVVNNGTARVVSFPMTTSTQYDWNNPSAYSSLSLGSVQLNAGNNTVTFSMGSGSDIYPWNVDYLDVYGANQPGNCPSGQIGVPPACAALPTPPTTPPVDPPVTPPTGSGQRCVVGLPGAGGNATLSWGFGSGGHYPQNSNWITIGNYNGDSPATVKSRIPASCGQIIVHGFSAGGGTAGNMACSGETLNGRIVGYILDESVDGTFAGCNRAGIKVVVYACRINGGEYFMQANGYNTLTQASRLGVSITDKPSSNCKGSTPPPWHTPYTPNGNDAGHVLSPLYSQWW